MLLYHLIRSGLQIALWLLLLQRYETVTHMAVQHKARLEALRQSGEELQKRVRYMEGVRRAVYARAQAYTGNMNGKNPAPRAGA